MRPLPVEEEEVDEDGLEEQTIEEDELESIPEDDQRHETSEGAHGSSLDPLLMLRDVGLFRDNCTVVFETVSSLKVHQPPTRSQPRSMPDVRQQIRLRNYLKRRHRARWEAEQGAS